MDGVRSGDKTIADTGNSICKEVLFRIYCPSLSQDRIEHTQAPQLVI